MAGFKNMTKLERRDYLRAYRARKGKECDCGRPADLMKWGEPVCWRCNQLENRRDLITERREIDAREYLIHLSASQLF